MVRAAMAFVAAMALTACSSGPDGAAPAPTTVLSRPTPAPATVAATGDVPGVGDDQLDTLPGEDPATPVPEPTGVPGVVSEVPFCRAYARLLGTQQVLGVAISFGDLDPLTSLRWEAAAAPAVSEAFAAVVAGWPDELAAERDVVIDDVLGPFVRRARVATEALMRSGASDGDLATLASLWVELLAARDNETFELAMPGVGAAVEAVLDAAARDLATRLVPLVDDPSMVREGVATPLTASYLESFCPEVVPIAVGDEI